MNGWFIKGNKYGIIKKYSNSHQIEAENCNDIVKAPLAY